MAESAEGSYADEGFVGDGPETDEEMPLADHIEEMVRRLGYVIVGFGTVADEPLVGVAPLGGLGHTARSEPGVCKPSRRPEPPGRIEKVDNGELTTSRRV